MLYQNLRQFGYIILFNVGFQCHLSLSTRSAPINKQMASYLITLAYELTMSFSFKSHEYCKNHGLFVTKYIRNVRFVWLFALFRVRDAIRLDFDYFDSLTKLFSGSFGSGLLMNHELLWIFPSKVKRSVNG